MKCSIYTVRQKEIHIEIDGMVLQERFEVTACTNVIYNIKHVHLRPQRIYLETPFGPVQLDWHQSAFSTAGPISVRMLFFVNFFLSYSVICIARTQLRYMRL